MQHQMRNQNDLICERCTPHPDTSQITDVLHAVGAAEGFSLEWIFDRFDRLDTVHRRHS